MRRHAGVTIIGHRLEGAAQEERTRNSGLAARGLATFQLCGSCGMAVALAPASRESLEAVRAAGLVVEVLCWDCALPGAA